LTKKYENTLFDTCADPPYSRAGGMIVEWRRYIDISGRQLNGRPERGVYIYKGKKYVAK
jgi:hypothetical protein